MTIANILTGIASGVGGGGVGMAIVQAIISTRSRRAEAAKTESEAESIARDTWIREAHETYSQLKEQYKECLEQVKTSKQSHDEEMGTLRREHAEQMGKVRRDVTQLKDALIKSVDRVDELLPYTQGLPDEKVREIRNANKAVRIAVWVQS